MAQEKMYVVERPIKGVQRFLVRATSAAAAKAAVNDSSPSAEAISFDVHTYGKAASAIEDKKGA